MIDNYFKCIPMLTKEDWQYHRDRNPKLTSVSVWECPQNYLLPFQIKRQQAPESVWEFKLFNDQDVEVLDLSINIDSRDLKMRTLNGADYIFYRSDYPVTNLPCGIHYYYFSDGVREWYSDYFTIMENVEFAEPIERTREIVRVEIGTRDGTLLIGITNPSNLINTGRLSIPATPRLTDIYTNFNQLNILE